MDDLIRREDAIRAFDEVQFKTGMSEKVIRWLIETNLKKVPAAKDAKEKAV